MAGGSPGWGLPVSWGWWVVPGAGANRMCSLPCWGLMSPLFSQVSLREFWCGKEHTLIKHVTKMVLAAGLHEAGPWNREEEEGWETGLREGVGSRSQQGWMEKKRNTDIIFQDCNQSYTYVWKVKWLDELVRKISSPTLVPNTFNSQLICFSVFVSISINTGIVSVLHTPFILGIM